MKYFLKKLLGHERFRSMVSWATNFFFEKLVKPPSSPPAYLMCVLFSQYLNLISGIVYFLNYYSMNYKLYIVYSYMYLYKNISNIFPSFLNKSIGLNKLLFSAWIPECFTQTTIGEKGNPWD